jgi:dihydroorotase
VVFLKEGYFADLVLVDLKKKNTVTKNGLLYKCQWSPFEGRTFGASVEKTFVNGNMVYDEGKIIESGLGKRLTFNKK